MSVVVVVQLMSDDDDEMDWQCRNKVAQQICQPKNGGSDKRFSRTDNELMSVANYTTRNRLPVQRVACASGCSCYIC